MGALDTRRAPGQGALRRDQLLLARAHRGGGRDPRELGTPLLIHQPSYSMLNRWIEHGLLDVLERQRRRRDRVLAARARGCSPTATCTASRRTRGVRRGEHFDRAHAQRGEPRARARARTRSRARRGQSLAQMAIAWVLRDPRVSSALIGASSVAQLEQNVAALWRPRASPRTSWPRSTRHAVDGGINIWAASSNA